MNSIYNIVDELNSSLSKLFSVANEFNGIAELVSREGKTVPTINEKHVGIDDIFAIRVYHRLNGLSSNQRHGGYGRHRGNQANDYGLSMVVFSDYRKLSLHPDEITVVIQANMPEEIKMKPYRSVLTVFNSATLDNYQVYRQEYGNDDTYRLKADQFFFKINYTVETVFDKRCFIKCP